jgi:hypothetical protein
MVMLGITLLAIVVFFMYMWKSNLEKKESQGCSTCPSKKNADTY